MTPNAVIAAMVRLAASLGLLGTLAVGPALAGDRALAEFIGYSADGRYFAFEEFGIQAGSGFPYANIYVVDLPADKWVSGSPFRARIDSETTRIGEVRQQARAAAAATLDKLDIVEPAHLIALNGDGEPGDGLSLEFGAVSYIGSELQSPRTLELEIFSTGSPNDCTTLLGEDAKGYALLLHGEGTTTELHRDGDMLPASRGCAMTYSLYAVVARPDTGTLDDAVAIVSVYPFGFEGPDRRFLAVPLGD